MKAKKATPPVQEKIPAFPPDTCGACHYAQAPEKPEEGGYTCWGALPTVMIDENGDTVSQRGAFVEASDPACHVFKPRINA